MAQLDPDRYRRLTKPDQYNSSDGLYYDRDNDSLVFAIGGTVIGVVTASGSTADLELTGEARGDILRRGASAWERHSAKDSGKILVGDGTDIASVAVSGDASLSSAGALTVTDVTVGSDAAGDLLYKSSATALARLAKGTASQFLRMNVGATAPEWSDLDETTIQYAEVSISSADITGTGAGQLGHAEGYPLVAAPGSDKAIELLSAVIVYEHDTADYTDGGNTTVNYAGGGAALSALVSAANGIGASADSVSLLLPTTPTNNQLAENTGINLVAAAAFTQPGTAAGVVRAKVAYRVHTLGFPQ